MDTHNDTSHIAHHINLNEEAANDPTTIRRHNEWAIAELRAYIDSIDPNLMRGMIFSCAELKADGSEGVDLNNAMVGSDDAIAFMLDNLQSHLDNVDTMPETTPPEALMP